MDGSLGGYQMVGQFLDKYLSYSQARAMQNDMNEYNSPVNQVARLRQAGLSPWVMNGDGNQSAQPVMTDSKLGESLGAIADRSIAKHQAEAQIKLAYAQAKQTESQTRTIDTLLKYLDESEQVRIENQRQDTSNKLTEQAETAKRVSRYDEQVDTDISLKKQTEAYYYAQSGKAKAETNRINRMLSWEVKEAKSRISVNEGQVAVLRSQCDLNTYQIKQIVSILQKNKMEIEKFGFENWRLKHDNEIQSVTGVRPGTPAWSALTDILFNLATENQK